MQGVGRDNKTFLDSCPLNRSFFVVKSEWGKVFCYLRFSYQKKIAIIWIAHYKHFHNENSSLTDCRLQTCYSSP